MALKKITLYIIIYIILRYMYKTKLTCRQYYVRLEIYLKDILRYVINSLLVQRINENTFDLI